jgi:REP element-mobilizing transposase RayT
MSRALRLEYEGAVYHVTSRGNDRAAVFRDDRDRSRFLEITGTIAANLGWIVHAYCLMGNHYHLLIETPRANLSPGMQRINGRYTQFFNRRHRRTGHVLQGRYKAIHVEKEAHLLDLCRYVVLNPVRARLVQEAKACPGAATARPPGRCHPRNGSRSTGLCLNSDASEVSPGRSSNGSWPRGVERRRPSRRFATRSI